MIKRTFIPKALRPTPETIKGEFGVALLRAKNNHCSSLQDLAVRLGKEDPKSASDYISGKTKIDIVALVDGMNDPEIGPGLRSAFGALIGCRYELLSDDAGSCHPAHILPIADVLMRIAQMVDPDSDGGVAVTDAELLANGDAIDDAGIAIDAIRIALSVARSRARPVRSVA